MIYIASSWKNVDALETITDCLDQWALKYYAFWRDKGFHWSETDLDYDGEPVAFESYIECLRHPRAVEGYARDIENLDAATSLLLVMPSGRSAHSEFGRATGRGIPTCIYFPHAYRDGVEPELMYKMAKMLTADIDECMHFLSYVEPR